MRKSIAGILSICCSLCAIVATMAGMWLFAFGGCVAAVCVAMLGEV